MRVPARGRVRWAALIAIVGALAVGGVAYATIPGPNGVIHGCYKTIGGALRVIDTDAGGTCARGDTPLDWNQQGPGATSDTTILSVGPPQILFALDNGITVTGGCADLLVEVLISPATPGHLQLSGTTNEDTVVAGQSRNGANLLSVDGFDSVDVDVIARDSTVGTFAHIDVHGSVGAPGGGCTFWWMIIPSN